MRNVKSDVVLHVDTVLYIKEYIVSRVTYLYDYHQQYYVTLLRNYLCCETFSGGKSNITVDVSGKLLLVLLTYPWIHLKFPSSICYDTYWISHI